MRVISVEGQGPRPDGEEPGRELEHGNWRPEKTVYSLSRMLEKKERSEVGAEEALVSILSLKSFEPALQENKLGESGKGEPPGSQCSLTCIRKSLFP